MINHIIAYRNDFQILSLDLTLIYLRKAINAVFIQMIQRGCLLIFGDIKESGLPHQKGRGSVYINNWIPGALSNYSRIVKIIEKNKRYIKLREEQALPPLKAGELNRLGSLSVTSTKFKTHKLTFIDFPRDMNIYQKIGALRKKRRYEKRFPSRKLPYQQFIYPYKHRPPLIRIPTISVSISDNKYWMAECQGIGIPSIQIVDTTSAFDQVTYPIISNQRSLSFGSLIIDLFAEVMDNALFYKANTLEIKKKKLHEITKKARVFNKKLLIALSSALRSVRKNEYNYKRQKFEISYYKAYHKYKFRPITFLRNVLIWPYNNPYNKYEEIAQYAKRALRKIERKRLDYLKYLEESLEKKKLKRHLKSIILKDIFKFRSVKKYLYQLNKLILLYSKKYDQQLTEYIHKWGPLKKWGGIYNKKKRKAREKILKIEKKHQLYISVKAKVNKLLKSYKREKKDRKNFIHFVKAKYIIIKVNKMIRKLKLRRVHFRNRVRRSLAHKKALVKKYENKLKRNNNDIESKIKLLQMEKKKMISKS